MMNKTHLKPSQKLMVYIDNYCFYTTVKDLRDQKLLNVLNLIQKGDSGAGTRIYSYIDGKEVSHNVQINVLT